MVKTTKIESHSLSMDKTYPARIRAASDARLSFRVAGPIKSIFVNEGEYVKKGTTLAQLDPRDYEIQFHGTEAKYKEVKAEVERVTSLHDKGKVSDNEYDKAISGLQQISAQHEAHKNALEDTKLKSPFSGHVSEIFFDANETVDAGMPVISVVETRQLEIVTHVPPKDLLNRHQFERFSCRTVNTPAREWPLKLTNIGSKANMNGLFPVYFILENKNDTTLYPGMSAEVIISYKSKRDQLFTVPSTAIFKRRTTSAIWILDSSNQTISAREVQVVRIHSSGKTVIKGQFSEGDITISAGVNSLEEGQEVSVMEEPSDSNVGGLL